MRLWNARLIDWKTHFTFIQLNFLSLFQNTRRFTFFTLHTFFFSDWNYTNIIPFWLQLRWLGILWYPNCMVHFDSISDIRNYFFFFYSHRITQNERNQWHCIEKITIFFFPLVYPSKYPKYPFRDALSLSLTTGSLAVCVEGEHRETTQSTVSNSVSGTGCFSLRSLLTFSRSVACVYVVFFNVLILRLSFSLAPLSHNECAITKMSSLETLLLMLVVFI